METKTINAGNKGKGTELEGSVPFHHAATLETSNFYMGSIMSFLAKGTETNGKYALMQYQAKPGNEPPPHIHERENETYFILEGHLEFYCDDKILQAGPGEFVFLPHGKAHAFYIRSPRIKVLISVQAIGDHAVGLDRYFLEMSSPAESMSLPETAITYIVDNPEHAVTVGAKHGVRILSPEQTKELLPHYPGFGVQRQLVKG